MKFKVGDRVRAIGKVDGLDLTGKCGRVIRVFSSPIIRVDICVEFDEPFWYGHDCQHRGKSGRCRWGEMSEFELLQNQKIVITTDGKETLARLYEDNKVVKSATAKCSPEDIFDFKIGADLAYERLMRDESHNEEWRKVNRPAKAGDYIRLTQTPLSFNKVGDILKVNELLGVGILVSSKDHPKRDGVTTLSSWCYLPHQYEVVEPTNLKCFTGKAVCIESNVKGVTVGKIYDFSKNDGRGESDRKIPILSYPGKTVDEINKISYLGIKFLEIKE